MRSKPISIQVFQVYISVFSTLERLGLMDGSRLMVTWERKPRMVLTQTGELEFENPQELYGATVSIWDPKFKVDQKRFTIVGEVE